MYRNLLDTELSREFELICYNFPGFGAPSLDGEVSIGSLVKDLESFMNLRGIKIVVANSVSSVIASFLSINNLRIISLEGNVTEEDAYFSGSSAKYDNPDLFKDSFLKELEKMKEKQPILNRYITQVRKADSQYMWTLGRDAHKISNELNVGDKLKSAGEILYVFNKDNCYPSSVEWPKNNADENFKLCALERAYHWPSVDVPIKLSNIILDFI